MFEMKSDHKVGKYSISVGGCISEYQGTMHVDSPEEAITIWCKLQESSPTEVSISSKSKESFELLDWARNNKEKVASIMKDTKAGDVYKIDYLINISLDKAKGNDESWDEYGGDSISPFSQG